MQKSADYMNGIRKAENLVNRARSWRKRYGMKECLGYDKHNQLADYISTLNLTYQERCEIFDTFNTLCDNLNKEN